MTDRLSMLVLSAPHASLGCSDPPPTPPRGSVVIRLSPPSLGVPGIATRTNCTAGTTGVYTYLLGKASSIADPVEQVRAGLLEHGHGINVSCTVKAIGGGRYSVNASLSGVDSNSRKVSTSFTLNGTLSATAAAADNPGQVAFFSPDTTHLRTLSDLPACKIGPVETAKDGALLAPFSCEALADSSDTIKGCQATGAIAIERCRTGKEED
jgi:hypothetical protein